jgi:ABC-type branched-subunit amino acid transport system substrate-binding protein
MKRLSRILLLTMLLTGQMFASFADRGVGKKKANKLVLNIKTTASFNASLNFNLRNGLKYSGSFLSPIVVSKKTYTPNQFSFNAFVTYKKANSVYIVPYKQKIFVADVRQGFAGTKLIIKMK